MKIELARHFGMCFGVRDALRLTYDLAQSRSITVLGELVHNPVVSAHLGAIGVREGKLADPASASTETVVITAHGAAESDRQNWRERGHEVFDTTCPLVRKAHRALECLILAGYFPVIIGRRDHAEVIGLSRDHPDAVIVESAAELAAVPRWQRIGVVAQTTQPVEHVRALVEALQKRVPESEIRFVDTVCQPTKDRQDALRDLCESNDTIVVVGGRNSNNTRQLVETAVALGRRVLQVERADELDAGWFRDSLNVGVTAGTSTLDETVREVVGRLGQISSGLHESALNGLLRAFA